jgi:hypothetical protein
MRMKANESNLAARLGMSVHVSPLRFKLKRLRGRHESATAECIEDWLVDVANARGARVVCRAEPPDTDFSPPTETELANEELIVAICQLQCRDRPQMLRLAAQLISQQAATPERLVLTAERERVSPILAELARQALHVEPAHALWRHLLDKFAHTVRLRDTLLHWTRLAEPIPANGRLSAGGWRLVA